MSSPFLALCLGSAMGLCGGLRHAFEPDHLAAVGTLVAAQKSARATLGMASWWGAGHAITLLLVGGTLACVGARMPEGWTLALELCVAIMLVALGLRTLGHRVFQHRARGRFWGPGSVHSTDRAPGKVRTGSSSLLFGVLHGLAGSGALATVAVATGSTRGHGLVFLGVYGLGATLGMSLFAYCTYRLIAGARYRFPLETMRSALGVLSVVTGVFWASPIVWHILLG